MQNKSIQLAALAALLAALAPAQAQDANALYVRSLAANCSSCHGTGGRAIDGGVVPGIAGMPAPYMVNQMKAFKSGARAAAVMHQIAKGYNDAQIEQLAVYFAAQPK